MKNSKLAALGKFLAELFKSQALDVIFSPEVKEKVINKINGELNVPLINEAKEKELLTKMWDAIEEQVRDVVAEG